MTKNNPNMYSGQEVKVLMQVLAEALKGHEGAFTFNQFSIQVDNRKGALVNDVVAEGDKQLMLKSNTERMKLASSASEMCDINDGQVELMVKLINSMPQEENYVRFDHIVKCIFVAASEMVDSDVELAKLLGITNQKAYFWLGKFKIMPVKKEEG